MTMTRDQVQNNIMAVRERLEDLLEGEDMTVSINALLLLLAEALYQVYGENAALHISDVTAKLAAYTRTIVIEDADDGKLPEEVTPNVKH